MHVSWRIITDTNSEKSAGRVLARFADEISEEIENVMIEEHHDGGHVIQFGISLKSTSWSDAVVESIEYGQRVGYGWNLGGSVRDDPDAFCSKFRVVGITSASWHLSKPE